MIEPDGDLDEGKSSIWRHWEGHEAASDPGNESSIMNYHNGMCGIEP
jgi:hypothetical protein